MSLERALDWSHAGATFSDKSARDEFGIAQVEIIQGIREGKLQYRQNDMHGNPWFRLFRSEVEALVRENHGEQYLKTKLLQHELAQIDAQIKKANAQITALSKNRVAVLAALEGVGSDELIAGLKKEQAALPRKGRHWVLTRPRAVEDEFDE
jgi:hypothetical protein